MKEVKYKRWQGRCGNNKMSQSRGIVESRGCKASDCDRGRRIAGVGSNDFRGRQAYIAKRKSDKEPEGSGEL